MDETQSEESSEQNKNQSEESSEQSSPLPFPFGCPCTDMSCHDDCPNLKKKKRKLTIKAKKSSSSSSTSSDTTDPSCRWKEDTDEFARKILQRCRSHYWSTDDEDSLLESITKLGLFEEKDGSSFLHKISLSLSLSYDADCDSD